MTALVLEIINLNLSFARHGEQTAVLHDVCLSIARGERVALVGESGSGKSVTARIVLGLLGELASARITGEIRFEGQDLGALSPAGRHALRGTKMSMIFQDPTSSLNPAYTIGAQFHEVLRRGAPKISAKAAKERAGAMLAGISMDQPDRVLGSYPFQLSGGMNQRVMIAMALANTPSLLIADEPGTALDVTVQAQTLKLMRELVEDNGTAVLFITHNIGVVREFADRVYVLYRGRIVEKGATHAVLTDARHPYTRALLAAVPRLTGGGIADIGEETDVFAAPMFDHGPGAEARP
ncbi:MAG: ABC transporter ATP-binding protein [Alphaproteobacteria bacterium]|nr:ABC transporter ATP-binding protein [Alphaproteobacteria bacterium]